MESSFYAFKKTLDRFIYSYELFIKEFEKGNVYVSKKHEKKIFELLENDDDEAVQKLIDEDKVEKYDSKDFKDELFLYLENDLNTLKKIKQLWEDIRYDPKLSKLIKELSTNPILKNQKLIIFTESKETAEYLANHVNKEFGEIALLFTGSSKEYVRGKVIENFDAKAKLKKDDYRILVSTEVLSEGVNLHRSNVVINYDIPWNPTRLIQRVGRINRVDTPFDKIYIFNFFPTKQSNEEIKLREAAIAKIHAFLTLLGGDAALLTEGEPVGSHELFNKLLSKQTITGEDELEESELKYLQIIKDIRDNNPDLFNHIKLLPKKARSAKRNYEYTGHLLTYFRRGKIEKFYLANPNSDPVELDFLTTAKLMECSADEEKQKLPKIIYELLEKNKKAFFEATTEEIVEHSGGKSGKDRSISILRILKASLKNNKQLTDEQEEYFKKVIQKLEEGALPKQTTKKTWEALEKLGNDITNPLKIIAVLQTNMPQKFLEEHYARSLITGVGKREVILSIYFNE